MNSDKIFVVAGNHDQYKSFVKRKIEAMHNAGDTSVSLSHFVYVDGPERFRGFNRVHGFFVGTFRERRDIDQIAEMIRIANLLPYTHKFYP